MLQQVYEMGNNSRYIPRGYGNPPTHSNFNLVKGLSTIDDLLCVRDAPYQKEWDEFNEKNRDKKKEYGNNDKTKSYKIEHKKNGDVVIIIPNVETPKYNY